MDVGYTVLMLMAPVMAEDPYTTEEAPFTSSICSTSSIGRNPQSGLPASPLIMGMSSTITMTLLPRPELNPLPPLIWGSLSTIAIPGILSMALSTLEGLDACIDWALSTSIVATDSSTFCSYLEPETITVLSSWVVGLIKTSKVIGRPLPGTFTMRSVLSYPMQENTIT